MTFDLQISNTSRTKLKDICLTSLYETGFQ